MNWKESTDIMLIKIWITIYNNSYEIVFPTKKRQETSFHFFSFLLFLCFFFYSFYFSVKVHSFTFVIKKKFRQTFDGSSEETHKTFAQTFSSDCFSIRLFCYQIRWNNKEMGIKRFYLFAHIFMKFILFYCVFFRTNIFKLDIIHREIHTW